MTDSDGPSIVITNDPETSATAAADHIARTLRQAVAERGRADWATTGGSAAPAMYRALCRSPWRDEVPWDRVHVWWGDDRFVPRDHPLSNIKPLDDILLDPEDGIRIPLEQLHPVRTTEAIAHGRDAGWAAAALATELADAGLSERDGWPVLDLIVIGIGGDGHLLSVFPGSPALDDEAWALAIPAPDHIEPHVERVTLNPALLGVARDVLAVVNGAGKADILGQIFGTDVDPRRWPAQLARRTGATWIVDEAAAARLPR